MNQKNNGNLNVKLNEVDDTILLTISRLDSVGSPSAELTKICGAINQRSFAQKVFAQHPNLRQSAYKLINLITIYWPDPNNPKNGRLIDRCLGNALESCHDIYYRNDASSAIDLEITFIKKVYEVLCDVFKTKLMVNSKHAWRPHDLSDEPLTDVLKKKEVDALTWTSCDSNNIPYGKKIVIASRVFSMKELNVAGLVE